MGSFVVCATICCIILIGESTASILPPTLDGANVWITLANAMHADTMCISMTTPSDPFCTCLVGVPIGKKRFGKLYNESVQQNCTAPGILQPRCWCQDTWQKTAGWDETWYKDLRSMHDFPALPSQPQELNTLGTLHASLCFYIDCTPDIYTNSINFDVSPKGISSNASPWCNWTLKSQLASGMSAIALPSDLFLICGERVWKGLQAKLSADHVPLAN